VRPAATHLPVAVGQLTTTHSEFEKLEERVTRLERLLHSTVSLVHTLIERENQAKSARKG
jgi:hypothetical protein